MERERITISIKKRTLNEIDKVIDGTDIRNRSHAIETLVSRAMNSRTSKKAVVMLGGDDAVKNVPAAKNFLSKLKDQGYEKVVIAVGYLADKIKDKLGDGAEFGLDLTYSDKGEGTGGSLFIQKKYLTETFIVFNSKKDIDIDLEKIYDFHKKTGLTATVVTDSLESLNGIFVIEPKIFESIHRGFSMLEDDILPKLAAEGQVAVFPIIK